MSAPVYVYFPDDEADYFIFNGTNFWLHPNGITELDIPKDAKGKVADHWKGYTAADIGRFCEEHMGRWGAKVLPADLAAALNLAFYRQVDGVLEEHHLPGSSEDSAKVTYQALVDAAEKAYMANTKKWAEELRLDWLKRAAPMASLGVEVSLLPHEAKAKDWMTKHGLQWSK